MNTKPLIAVLGIAILLGADGACSGKQATLSLSPDSGEMAPSPSADAPEKVSPTPGVGDAATSNIPKAESPDGATWILESLNGRPPIQETFITLKLDEGRLGGFDGCNSYGGEVWRLYDTSVQ